jgi:FAD/FMN-containing dehydrogenase
MVMLPVSWWAGLRYSGSPRGVNGDADGGFAGNVECVQHGYSRRYGATMMLPRRQFMRFCTATPAVIAAWSSLWAQASPGGDEAVLERALRALEESLAGDLLLPESAGFEPSRTVGWSASIPDRRPDLIVRARTAGDVIKTVDFARHQACKIAVRGGGHSWCAASLRDGGVLLDVSNLRDISIDPGAHTAVIGPGVQSAELMHRLSEYGLAFPVAHCPTVPMSGYLLCGGLGWNSTAWGSACANVSAIEMITADGRHELATPERNADLYWAARGAGPGFFAAITRYHLRLHPLPAAITSSTYFFPAAAVDTVTELIDSLYVHLRPEIELTLIIATPPPTLDIPHDKVCIVSAVAFSDTAAAAERALQPLNSDPRVRHSVLTDVNAPTDFNGLFTGLNNALPGGKRYAVDNIWSDRPLREILSGMPVHYARAPSPQSFVLAVTYPPAFELPQAAFSLSRRSLVFNYTLWDDAQDDALNGVWHDAAMALLEPYQEGRFIAELDLAKHPAYATQCFPEASWKRIQDTRQGHDRDRVFHAYPGLS